MRTVQEKTDVLVVGGGTAGVVAAVQSARAGAATVLLEMSSYLGGAVVTYGSCQRADQCTSMQHLALKGIGAELIGRAFGTEHSGGNGGGGDGTDGHAYVLVAENACLEAGVRILLHEVAVDARWHRGVWRVRTIGKGLERIITAHEIVDSTADGDVAGAAGLARMKSRETRTGTLAFKLGGYDAGMLNKREVEQRRLEAVRSGVLQRDDLPDQCRSLTGFLRQGGVGCHRLAGIASADSAAQTAVDLEGRQHLFRLIRFVRGLPGCARARVDYMSPRTALRETYRVAGDTVVRYQDWVRRRRSRDDICYIRNVRAAGGASDGACVHPQASEGYLTVPFGAMVPRGATGLLTAGRCVSCDEGAFPLFRAWSTCLATGQAAGAAAALGAVRGIPSRHIPVEEIRSLLAEHGAMVP